MATALMPYGLRTEYAREPIGLDEPAPRFGWLLAMSDFGRAGDQLAYQIKVASSESALRAAPDMWDSGRIESDQTAQVSYAGEPLRAFTRYSWAVRVWDSAGVESDWSEPASFETGPLAESDWDSTRWISRDRTNDSDDARTAAPLLRRSFRLSRTDIAHARLYVSGLGYGEYFLDGQRIGSAFLDPAPTNYDRTVLFSSYDVTQILTHRPDQATHALGAALGRGRYAEPSTNTWRWEQAPWWDYPKLRAQLIIWFADGTEQRVGTDLSWRSIDGPVRVDSLYLGEVQDARFARTGWHAIDYDDSEWPAAIEAPAPRGRLRAQPTEPIEIADVVLPVGLSEPSPGVHVYDLGQQMAGWAVLQLPSEVPAGTEIRIRYGERLLPDGTVDNKQVHVEGELQTDTFVMSGEGIESCGSRFTYKGFQYVQVDGLPVRPGLADLRGLVAHTAVESAAELESDNELVNRLHRCTRWAVLNNLHGVPTDTPVFEKNGWTGDAHLTVDVAAYNFRMSRFYTKWLDDWADSQLPSGELPPIVPTPGWGYEADELAGIRGPIPAWDVAYPEIAWAMYRHYGDVRLLERHYDGMRRYLDFIVGYVTDDVVLVGLGDWLPPGVHGMPPEGPGVYETAYARRFAELLREIALVLGREQDIPTYDEVSERLRNGFNRAFFDAEAGIYHGERPTDYRQSANVMALEFGLVPETDYQRVLRNLVDDIRARNNHLDTGVIGAKFLFPLLTRNGMVDLAFEVAMQPTYPSYGFWLERGATALYEMWEADSRSRNHHFFGHIDQWFVEDLAGVRPAAPGFATARIRPAPPQAIGQFQVGLDTIRGRLVSSWRRTPDGYQLRVEVPPNMRAEVHVPSADGTYRIENRGPGVHTL